MEHPSVSQLPSHRGLRQHLSSHPASLPANFQNETPWSHHDRHLTRLDAPYQSESINAPSTTLYETREPLAQDWIPGVEQHVARTTLCYESDTRWQQHLHNNRNVYAGSANPHPTLGSGGMTSVPYRMDGSVS